MGLIDKSRVRSAFHRRAGTYEEMVVVQKRVIERLAGNLRETGSCGNPGRILDVGAGTGMLLRTARALFPDAVIAGLDLAPGMVRTAMPALKGRGITIFVEGDAERLPFAGGSFDLVLSTSTYQWLNDLEPAFSEVFRVLAPAGSFRFALFGEDTLLELKGAYRKALSAGYQVKDDRTHRFFSEQEVRYAMEKAGFSGCFTESVWEREYHADVPALLRSLRGIGAGNASGFAGKGLAGRKIMQNMMDAYLNDYGEKDGIPATYQVVYGKGAKY
jgi:malonyl-CoA O-methyltransferase